MIDIQIPDYEQRLDQLFSEAFSTNDPAMLDWVKVKFELKSLRKQAQQQDSTDDFYICPHCHRKFGMMHR